ncbi:hypothetical protein EPD60_03380 [Flaviaesturariibacter flavus]|uniref:Uncharacterized protein n=1 Tax=Flaviaesturariibacter flavus TaxID=2502780 RepID=A0A4R1BNF5_9BACT|nr:hypothetical protein [Flaviaesturariibacter flavus]TCJ18816.1 hypothetical protein EPD60_03380 [Flaviaesturariibacter flavus]
MNEQPMSEQESLRLITEMIGKAKKNFHETGTSAILWGTDIAVCGLTSFAERYWNFKVGFDVWMLTLAALVPQVVISVRESRQRVVRTHVQEAMNAVWLVYGLSIFALVFYFNVVPGAEERALAARGTVLLEQVNGVTRDGHIRIPSYGSLLILLYGIPTLATGIAQRFRPMLVGAVLCYLFFIASCFTTTTWDMLFNGLAGIANWLVPGLILRARHRKQQRSLHV